MVFWGVAALLAVGLMVGIYLVSPDQSHPEQSNDMPRDLDELSRLAQAKGSDKGFPGHWYTEAYERLLRPWKDKPIRIAEIGIANGGSLRMWHDYFAKATVYGIDILDGKRFENARVRTCIADQAKRDQLKRCLDQFGGQFDLFVDDGGHTMQQQQVSFGFIFPYVRPGGFYVIEDLHTSMPEIFPGFEANPDGSNTTLAMIFGYIRTAPPVFASQYMAPAEIAYLNAEVATLDLFLANNQAHSMMAVFHKRWSGSAAALAAANAPAPVDAGASTATSAPGALAR